MNAAGAIWARNRRTSKYKFPRAVRAPSCSHRTLKSWQGGPAPYGLETLALAMQVAGTGRSLELSLALGLAARRARRRARDSTSRPRRARSTQWIGLAGARAQRGRGDRHRISEGREESRR